MIERLRERRTTIILMAVVSLLVITLDTRGNAFIDRSRRVATELFSPLRTLGHTLAKPFENAWHGAFDYDKVRKENIKLRDEAGAQVAAGIQAQANNEAYGRLRIATNLPNIGNLSTVMCEVTAGSASNFEQGTLEINCGSTKGLRSGMVVMTPAGVIGSVRQVSETRARVRLLWDPNLAVTAKIVGLRTPTADELPSTTTTKATTTTTPRPTAATRPARTTVPPDGAAAGETPTESTQPVVTEAPTTTTTQVEREIENGISHGYGRGQLIGLDLIDEKVDVRVGDAVLTKGESFGKLPSLFPPNLPIGKVADVRRQPGSTQLFIRVQPLADLERIDFVSVLLYDAQG